MQDASYPAVGDVSKFKLEPEQVPPRWGLRRGLRCIIAFAALGLLAYGILAPHGAATTAAPDGTFVPPPPELSYDPSTRTITFDNARRDGNATLCVVGVATAGVEKLFAYTANGRGTAVASFQRDDGGRNVNTFKLYAGAALRRGTPTDVSCGTGTLVGSKVVAT
jgi:hypothetical protein